MASSRPSGFTEAEEHFLQSEHAEYRRTPGSEKERFRNRCALHIIRLRGLVEDNRYINELFNNKVRNWFQNNAPVKKTRLPLSINQAFHPERVWGMKHKDDIRTGIEESRPETVADTAPYVVVWNAKRKEMWAALSAEEKKIYQRLAEEWSEHGPDDDLKPEMAERRAVAWMKAVALLFWQQCRMPIFIYGCFEDTKAQLQGATFDTSLLFEGSEERKGKPTFRSSKDWATDFRRYFYEFFTPFIRPDLASPDAMEYLRTKSKRVVEPFDFETNEDGWPLLPDADVERWDTLRRQEVLRMWLTRIYGFASGQAVLAVPWRSITKKPHKFFAPGMLPSDVDIGDPSKIPKIPLGKFYDHVHRIEQGLVPDIPRFQFSNFETGPESNREYPVALNTTDVPEWKPRRAKKKVQPPTFDAAPGNTDPEDDGDDEEEGAKAKPKTSKRGGMFNPGKKFYKDVEKLRKEKERAKAKEEKAAAKASKKRGGTKKKRKAKAKGKSAGSSEDDVWNTDEDTPAEDEIFDFEAVDNDVPGVESEESEAEDVRVRQLATPGLASDDSDDEVEEALERYEDVLTSSAVRKAPNAGASTSRAVSDSVSAVRNTQRDLSSTQGASSTAVQAPKGSKQRLPSTVVGNSPPPQVVGKGKQRARESDQHPTAVGSDATGFPPTIPHADSPHPSHPVRGASSLAQSAVVSAEPSAPSPLPAHASTTTAAPALSPPAAAAAAEMSTPHRQSTSVLPVPDGASSEAVTSDTPVAPHTDWAPPTKGNASPSDVPAEGAARLKYLRSLDGERAYLEMLDRAQASLSVTTPIRVKPPLFWASWGYKSPFLPKDAHSTDKGSKMVQSILNFLKKGVSPSTAAADVQRYCLVMGMMLKNIMALQIVDPGETWPKELPTYMATSTLTFDMRTPLLNVCETLFPAPSSPADRIPTPDAGPDDVSPLHATPPNPTPTTAPSKPTRARQTRAPERKSAAAAPSSSQTPSASVPNAEGSPALQPRGKAGKRGPKQRHSATAASGEGTPAAADDSAPAGVRRSSRLRK